MSDKKLKVLIISTCIELPVPAVKGGAVSALIESLVLQNEKHNRLDLSVVSIFDELAVKKSLEYNNTEFVFIKPPFMCNITDNSYEFIFNKIRKSESRNPHKYAWKYFLIYRLKKLLKQNDYDRVVFENMGYMLNVLKDGEIEQKYKGKLFFHLHNDIPNNIYIDGVKSCTLLLISDYLRKKIVRLCGNEVESKIKILHNGFNYSEFAQPFSEKEATILREKLQIDNDKKIVVFAGRIDPTKGIEELATAFNSLERSDTVLLVIGSHNFGSNKSSPFEVKMKDIFMKMGDKVRFTGFIPHSDIWKYYKLSDLAVLPSIWEEPAGLTIVESMSAGLPVITTNSGGIPEFIDSRFGIVLERDDNLVENIKLSINKILDNLPEWKLRGEKSSKYISEIVDEEKYYNKFCEYIF